MQEALLEYGPIIFQLGSTFQIVTSTQLPCLVNVGKKSQEQEIQMLPSLYKLCPLLILFFQINIYYIIKPARSAGF